MIKVCVLFFIFLLPLITKKSESRNGVGVCDQWCGGDGSTTCGGTDGTSRDFYALDIPSPALGVNTQSETGGNRRLDRVLELHNAARYGVMHAAICFMHGAGVSMYL